MGKSVARITRPAAVPRLHDGDRLDADEFLRRYAAEKRACAAELIGGVVRITRTRVVRDGQEMIVPPIDALGHSEPHADLITWLRVYAAHTPHTGAGGPATTVLPSSATAVEPDAGLRILPEAGGRASIGADGFIHGSPELLLEISHTSTARDLGEKRVAFEAAGVKEYIVWRTRDAALDWFVLKRKRYVPLVPHTDGSLRSAVFPGLWLDVPALIAGDMARVLALLQQGTASAEHAAFVAKLRKSAGRK